MIELSVIIVNYNGKRFFKDCIASLHKTLGGISYEILVVDNASTDGSPEYLNESFPEVVLINSKENLGFGKGNNLGVKHAKGNYILLLNNDTIVLNSLKPILDFIKTDSTIGVVGINMLNRDKKYLPAVGKFPAPGNLYRLKNIFNLGYEFKSGNFSRPVYEVDWISGAFMMMPKEVYFEIEGFDEDYFLYVEDVDICKKIADKGYKRIYMPKYNYIHFVGHNRSKDHYLITGCRLYVNKHMKGVNKILSLVALKINSTIKQLKNIIKK